MPSDLNHHAQGFSDLKMRTSSGQNSKLSHTEQKLAAKLSDLQVL
jgi:hypothetical protein